MRERKGRMKQGRRETLAPRGEAHVVLGGRCSVCRGAIMEVLREEEAAPSAEMRVGEAVGS